MPCILPVLGKPAFEVWGEIWEYIEIPLQEAMNGIPVERHAQPLFFERLQDGGPNNKHEEVHATWCESICTKILSANGMTDRPT